MARAECANRLKQLVIALHEFHDAQRHFPPGIVADATSSTKNATWIVSILPFLEEDAQWQQANFAYSQDASPFHNPPHSIIANALMPVQCPLDSRVRVPQRTRNNRLVGLTSYLGISGTDLNTRDGVLFADSQVSFGDILDGTSNTLILGERPPSPDFFYGWWYAGVGQQQTGSVTIVLGVRELNTFGDNYGSCFAGPYHFGAGQIDRPCDRFHFWSLHENGGNFAFCDGSVRNLGYAADKIIPALATCKGSEASISE